MDYRNINTAVEIAIRFVDTSYTAKMFEENVEFLNVIKRTEMYKRLLRKKTNER